MADETPAHTGGAKSRADSRRLRGLALSLASWTGFSVTALGTVLILFGAPPAVGSVTDIRGAEPGVVVLAIGVVITAFVPAIRPLAMAIRWTRRRDYKYAAIAGCVFAILLAGVLIKI